jgi:hypothetical protein
VAIYSMDKGCIAYPDLLIQALCLHHERKAQPRGSMDLILDLRIREIAARVVNE